MILSEKIAFLFNKFFISFIKDFKKCASDEVQKVIRNKYKIVDKSSLEHIELFWSRTRDQFEMLASQEDATASEEILNLQIFETYTIANILFNFTDAQTFWNHINILLIFAYLYHDQNDDENQIDILTQKVVDVIGDLQ